MPDLDTLFRAIAALCAGGAAASGWTVSVIGSNVMFDGLDAGRADRMLRKFLTSTATFQAVILVVAAGFAILGGAIGAFITALIGALGFMSNKWTLSPRRDKALPGARRKEKTRRVLAVSLTLMVTVIALICACLAAFGI